jgi:hypothetical protein
VNHVEVGLQVTMTASNGGVLVEPHGGSVWASNAGMLAGDFDEELLEASGGAANALVSFPASTHLHDFIPSLQKSSRAPKSHAPQQSCSPSVMLPTSHAPNEPWQLL